MVSEWQNTTVGNFSPFCYGKGLPERERNQTGLIPVYGSNGTVGYHNKALINEPAIIIGRKGTIGTVNYSKTPCWAIDTTFYVADVPYGDLLFTYYLLKYLQLDKFNFDSAVPGLNRDTAHNQKIQIPPLAEQKTIAHILGTLDDKIELNQQMNRNLEAIAQAIFKSWFVDFDPVRAKMEGRQPAGMDAATAALFPDSFEDLPIGEIPKGWTAVSLGDVITLYDSRRIPLSNRERAQRQGKYPYYGAASVMDYVDDYLFDGVYILMGEDGSVIDRNDHPVIQYIWGKFWVNNHAHVLQGSNGVSNEHLMLFLKQINICPYVTGAVQLKLNQGNLRCIPFILPSPQVCHAFGANVSRFYAHFRANHEQSLTLATIRDTLLPKLMSGEIRVKEAEEILEDVA